MGELDPESYQGFTPVPVNKLPSDVATPEQVPRMNYRQQIGGTHYTDMPIQPFDVIATEGLNFWEGSALKYLMRYKHKGGVEDLMKAQHYIDILIAREKGVKEWWKTPPRS
jgi:hypothetical protein